MHRVDRAQVQEILHEYKKECYLLEHRSTDQTDVEKTTERLVEGILSQNFHYHFHKPVNRERAETLGLIENYTREAVLPPVVGKLAERIVLLEKRYEAGVRALERLLLLIGEPATDEASTNGI